MSGLHQHLLGVPQRLQARAFKQVASISVSLLPSHGAGGGVMTWFGAWALEFQCWLLTLLTAGCMTLILGWLPHLSVPQFLHL